MTARTPTEEGVRERAAVIVIAAAEIATEAIEAVETEIEARNAK